MAHDIPADAPADQAAQVEPELLVAREGHRRLAVPAVGHEPLTAAGKRGALARGRLLLAGQLRIERDTPVHALATRADRGPEIEDLHVARLREAVADAEAAVEALQPGSGIERGDARDLAERQILGCGAREAQRGGRLAPRSAVAEQPPAIQHLDLQRPRGRERGDLGPLYVQGPHAVGRELELPVGEFLDLAGDPIAIDQDHHIGLRRPDR